MGGAKSTPEPPPGMEPGLEQEEGLELPEELPGDVELHPMAVPDVEVLLWFSEICVPEVVRLKFEYQELFCSHNIT